MSVGLQVSDLPKSCAYWCDLLGMSKFSKPAPASEATGGFLSETVGYGEEQASVSWREACPFLCWCRFCRAGCPPDNLCRQRVRSRLGVDVDDAWDIWCRRSMLELRTSSLMFVRTPTTRCQSVYSIHAQAPRISLHQLFTECSTKYVASVSYPLAKSRTFEPIPSLPPSPPYFLFPCFF